MITAASGRFFYLCRVQARTDFIELDVPGIQLGIRREDLLHPEIQGNKYRKLKYNLEAAAHGGFGTILTFGGAYSNHIAAVAAAGKTYGFSTVGIIRGEELSTTFTENPTLSYAAGCGMRLTFVSRESYADKENPAFLARLQAQFPGAYILPEGGTNELAVRGCEEILTPGDSRFQYICCAAGTGGTVAGLARKIGQNQRLFVFPAVGGNEIKAAIGRWTNKPVEVVDDYRFGGYGKTTDSLIAFINAFHLRQGIPLDPVYTGKMLFGIADMIRRELFPRGSEILAIHTGGLQGIAGMNAVLKRKNKQLIQFDV